MNRGSGPIASMLVGHSTGRGEASLSGDVLIHGARVLLGPELDATSTDVLIADGRIDLVSDSIATSPDVHVLDAAGLTLMPGFIDAHVHIDFYDPATVLRGGVTTVRDLGWPVERIFGLVAASKEYGFDGPSIVAAGSMLTAPGGYPSKAAWAPAGTALEVSTTGEARDAVASLAQRGAVVIKVALAPDVGPVLDIDLLRDIVVAAQELDLKVTAHVSGLDALYQALDARVDELAHMPMGLALIPDGAIERMVQQQMAVVPTLSIREGRERDIAIENLRCFVRAGGRVVYGTDLGNEGPKPGIDETEIAAMVAAGMTAKDILKSATSGAAAWLGLADKGVIASGYDADLLLIEGDPLSDLPALSRVRRVWRRGRPVVA